MVMKSIENSSVLMWIVFCDDTGTYMRVRPSAHEQFFAAAGECFLAVRTEGERNAAFSRFPRCQCVRYGFCRVGCCVRSSAKNQGKEKKEVLGTSTCKSKTTERQFHKLYEDLGIHPKKVFGNL
jgi:hypothetical protein